MQCRWDTMRMNYNGDLWVLWQEVANSLFQLANFTYLVTFQQLPSKQKIFRLVVMLLVPISDKSDLNSISIVSSHIYRSPSSDRWWRAFWNIWHHTNLTRHKLHENWHSGPKVIKITQRYIQIVRVACITDMLTCCKGQDRNKPAAQLNISSTYTQNSFSLLLQSNSLCSFSFFPVITLWSKWNKAESGMSG
jgi:hypothetical protein